MRRTIAVIACVCFTSPVLADPDPPPTPPTAPPTSGQYRPPPINPALPVVRIATMPRLVTMPSSERDVASWTPTIVSTAITGTLGAAMLVWWRLSDRYTYGYKGPYSGCVPKLIGMGHDANSCYAEHLGQDDAAFRRQHLWNDSEFALGAVTAASAFISAWLWARHYHASHDVLVTPGAVSGHF